MTGWGWAWMSLMMVGGVLLIALLVLVLLRGSAQETWPERSDDPLQILEKRLARSEIDVEEYQRRRNLLRSKDGSPTL